jgi:mono/diheme cytochrome c family protein
MNKSVAAILLAGMAVAAGGWFYFASMQKVKAPPGRAMVQVTVPELSADEKEGEGIFNANCAACHGEHAAGREGAGPPFVHVVYQPGHHGDQAFYLAARNGARAHHWTFGNMPSVEGVSEADIAKIITYVRAIQKANGIY